MEPYTAMSTHFPEPPHAVNSFQSQAAFRPSMQSLQTPSGVASAQAVVPQLLPQPVSTGGQVATPQTVHSVPAPTAISTVTSSATVVQQSTVGTAHGAGQSYQRLKVEDALSYLDQVKLQFGNHPQVYNDFLDIMKEFKSQTIDTPGVINRVSQLFRGHSDLIVGFNTFLPPGYKIEVSSNETISVHHPGQPVLTINNSVSPPIITTHATVDATAVNEVSTRSSSPPVSTSNNNSSSEVASPPSRPPSQNQQPSSQTNQPVEFNHAISYVNKIKNRFMSQPEVYKMFLEILHTYQKEQRGLKDGSISALEQKPLTESEVYNQVAKLFQNQDDLLSEFGQFLPDANGATGFQLSAHMTSAMKNEQNKKSLAHKQRPSGPMRRTPIGSVPPSKKLRLSQARDMSSTEMGKHGTLYEYAYFDRVRKAMRNSEVYDNFLRCLTLFTQKVVSRSELIQLVQPFLRKHPELYRRLKDFLGYKEAGMIDPVPSAVATKERVSGDLAMEIDYASCKLYGASYRGLPSSYNQPKCSGRTSLCREVLNDSLVSFPTWSEDSTFVSSRKTQFEEHIYRCEDERFELDVVIETNLSTIRILEAMQKKLSRMSSEDAARFKLDNCLGGCSEILHRKAISRIYGEKSSDIIDGLKKNPVVAVPLVLRRLKSKDEEWREAQKSFNKIWREQNEKYYLKSLDHQGVNFKQLDIKSLRSKALINDLETVFEERQEMMESDQRENATSQPHLSYVYRDRNILDDAASLIIHHVKRQSSVHKSEKAKIKVILRQLIPDLMFASRSELSDDEDESTDDDRESSVTKQTLLTAGGIPSPPVNESNEDAYVVFFINNTWYLFLRLHYLLCERLLKISQLSAVSAAESEKCQQQRKESTAVALRLKVPLDIEPTEYYSHFMNMVKNMLDGNLEALSYEDMLREMFGVNAYIVFTLDKLIQNLVRHVVNLVTEETSIQITECFLEERSHHSTGGSVLSAKSRAMQELRYQKQAETLLSDDNCIRLYVYKDESLVTFELLDTDTDEAENCGSFQRWSQYISPYVSSDCSIKELFGLRPVFLTRNIKKLKVRQSCNNSVNNDNTEYKFSSMDYKMSAVANTGFLHYKRQSLSKAKKMHRELTLRLHDRFAKKVKLWCDDHVTIEQNELCIDWLEGRGQADMKPCCTNINQNNDTDKSPYYNYNRYVVSYPLASSLSDEES